jgi:DNA polymerase IV (DinB-like DNA polymerase)
VVVLPGYEMLFLAGKPVSFLEDLPPHLEAALERLQLHTLGELAAAEPERLGAAVGPTAAQLLQAAARGEEEDPVALAAPPAWIQEHAVVRDRRSDRTALLSVIDGLVSRACRRLRPFRLGAQAIVVEAARREGTSRRSDVFAAPVADEERLAGVARELSEGLLEPAAGIRSLTLRLSRLEAPGHQRTLFPEAGGGRRSSL